MTMRKISVRDKTNLLEAKESGLLEEVTKVTGKHFRVTAVWGKLAHEAILISWMLRYGCHILCANEESEVGSCRRKCPSTRISRWRFATPMPNIEIKFARTALEGVSDTRK